MTDVRILLVDDEEFYLRLFSDILATRRFQVRTARSGVEALGLLQHERFDILITDLLMKEMDGLELTETVNASYPWVDVIVVTQRDDVRLAVRSMRMGVFEYLVKPVDRDELLLTLDRLLERRRLVDQQNKLLDESMQYLQAQTVYRRCLDILSTLDFENLCEMILRHMIQATGAQGGVLWLTSPEERPEADGSERFNLAGYRGLVSLESFPSSLTAQADALRDALASGTPFFAEPASVLGIPPGRGRSEALFIPLVAEGEAIGLLLLLDKLREDFTERDQNIARTMAQFSGIAIKNARRFQALERLGLRDQGTTAYNMTYFIDYAGKEIYKARRYGRSFSLVMVVIDRFEFLREHFKAELCGQLARKLVESLARIVRDSDILARVSDHEYYVLLPETDALGARMFVRRSQEAFQSESLIQRVGSEHPITITLGTATFPQDGDDFDQLLLSCREELNQARDSLFRRLRLGDRGFWETVRLLIGRPEEHRAPLEEAGEIFRLAEDSGGLNAHLVLDDAGVLSIEDEVCRQVIDQPDRRALIYALGGSLAGAPRPVEQSLAGAERARAYLIGNRGEGGDRVLELPAVTRVALEGDEIARARVLLVRSERLAYALLAERGEDGRLYGFHSGDPVMVEALIASLQEHYNFQRQY